jgi:hypothetical protein
LLPLGRRKVSASFAESLDISPTSVLITSPALPITRASLQDADVAHKDRRRRADHALSTLLRPWTPWKQSESAFEFQFWLETLDTHQAHLIRVLVDSGADGCFVNHQLVERLNLSTTQLDTPIPIRNADGSPSQGGPIEAFTDVILFTPPSFQDRLQLEVATLVYDIILGLPWLKRLNPNVN